jgi:hypothetical protein
MLHNIGFCDNRETRARRCDPPADLGPRRLAEWALKYREPTICPLRSFVDDGGLVSYWFAEADLHRDAANIVDKILKGAKPPGLPVEIRTRYQLKNREQTRPDHAADIARPRR